MYSGLQLVVPPAFDPITPADAKAHSRQLSGIEDALISGYIAAATRECETITKRAFITQTWILALKHFPGRDYLIGYQQNFGVKEYYKYSAIRIPKPPLQSIVSFNYFDTANNQFSMQQGVSNSPSGGNYLFDPLPEPGELRLPFAGIWPTTILLPASPIQITYTCGYPSFTGTCTVDTNGIATAASGVFDPRLVGTWMSVGGGSFSVGSYTDLTHISLIQSQNGVGPTLPISTPVAFRGSAVPVGIQSAILYLSAHFYQNRIPVATGRGLISVEVQSTLDALLAPYRVGIVGGLHY